ncbi:alpha/beta hydrolase [Spirochaetia bacterium]|nr:alpha/beta hydrolase [Spirochaetia bacterium]
MTPDEKYPMRRSKFRDGWMNMESELPEPRIDWIQNKILDIPYGTDPLQKIDVYYPNEQKEKYPLFIVIHGGGWSHMDKRDWHLYPSFFALEKGFMVVSINYRLAPKNKLPDATYDCFNAFEHIITNAGELKIDLSHIFVWGCSAGGNLGTASVLKYAKDERITIKAMVAVVPALDMAPLYKTMYNALGSDMGVINEINAGMGTNYPPWLFRLLRPVLIGKISKDTFGRKINFNKTPVAEYDASFYLSDRAPKFYFSYGEKDPLITQSDIRLFAAKLLEHGLTRDDIVFDQVKGAPHMGATHHFFDEDVIMRYINFCVSLL